MAQAFHEKLALALGNAKAVSNKQFIESSKVSRADREVLIKADCLIKIIRGWYLLCRPGTDLGETTPWYASYWNFLSVYLQQRFGQDYCLSASASLCIHLGSNTIPQQVTVVIKDGGNLTISLPHNTSLLIYNDTTNFPKDLEQASGLNVMPLELALLKMPASYYQKQPQDAEIALQLITKADKLLYHLLDKGMVQAAGRLVGALRHVGKGQLADQVMSAMLAAKYDVKENNPFESAPLLANNNRLVSPYAARIASLWQKGRQVIIDNFPEPQKDCQVLFEQIDQVYTQDAYHSLSIEGYQVSEDLIERIATGQWQPQDSPEDLQQKNAMAAKGYYEAFKAVKATIEKMLASDKQLDILQQDFSNWYLQLFSPAVTSGIIPAHQLAGYRNQAVYIRGAMHVPPPHQALADCMDALFDCLNNEDHPAARAVLAHWLIGFIHPFIDGNGRMARFAMNALFVSHGYPWTIIHVGNRASYMTALETASTQGELQDFAKFIFSELNI